MSQFQLGSCPHDGHLLEQAEYLLAEARLLGVLAGATANVGHSDASNYSAEAGT